ICAEKLKGYIKDIERKKIVAVCGAGNNGGDGFVCARYLINEGLNVKTILIRDEKDIKGDAKINFEILKKLNAVISKNQQDILEADIIIDAILGTGIRGEISAKASGAIQKINLSKSFVLSIDIPSGIDSDSGDILGSAVLANLTVALALPKLAFKKPLANFGKVEIADIGIPRQAIEIIKR
ncbi:MAG: NAD(P)H-hydrate epimerase, partial [Elusimicrobiota bacterium]|nr:NAD(P)H-hydrate epimerase [Elusimicrobiota bacterium]